MNIATFLVAFALTGATAVAPVHDQGAPKSTPTMPSKKEVADYGGYRPAGPSPGRVALWIPRLLLAPAYLVTEYGIRAPLSVVVPAAERADLPRILDSVFLFGPDHKAGILPAGFVSFGLNPSVGLYGFWRDALASGNEWTAHAEVWPTDWYAASVKTSARLDRTHLVRFQMSGSHRPDRVFYGVGPDTLQANQSRFTEAIADESVTLDWRYLKKSHVTLTCGLRSVDTGPGSYGKDPSLEREAATGAFSLPHGFGRPYSTQYDRLGASLESAGPSRTAVRVDAKIEQGSNLIGEAPSGWIRYGGVATGLLDIDGYGHVISLSVTMLFADPIGSSPLPFTELVAIGGDERMLGYLPGRLVDRSASVVGARYVWPVGPNLDGNLDADVGNVFDEHLQGFRPGLLRFSGDMGLALTGLGDYPIELVFGVGSETFERGAGIDSIRLRFSVNHGF